MRILIILIMLIMVAGCSPVVITNSNPKYFEDSGNKVDNYKICEALMENECSNNHRCVSWRIDKLECDNGSCFCD